MPKKPQGPKQTYTSKGHYYGGTKRPPSKPKAKRPMGPKKPK